MAGTLGIFGICLLFAGVHMTSGITVNIPDKVYKIARGDNVVIPCTFTPSTSIASISWTADPDVKDDPEINIVSYFTTRNKIKVYNKYKGRANIVVNIVKGTANLELQSATSADTRDYECKVQDPDNEEGRLSDKASLMVLGETSAEPFREMLRNIQRMIVLYASSSVWRISGQISSVINTKVQCR